MPNSQRALLDINIQDSSLVPTRLNQQANIRFDLTDGSSCLVLDQNSLTGIAEVVIRTPQHEIIHTNLSIVKLWDEGHIPASKQWPLSPFAADSRSVPDIIPISWNKITPGTLITHDNGTREEILSVGNFSSITGGYQVAALIQHEDSSIRYCCNIRQDIELGPTSIYQRPKILLGQTLNTYSTSMVTNVFKSLTEAQELVTPLEEKIMNEALKISVMIAERSREKDPETIKAEQTLYKLMSKLRPAIEDLRASLLQLTVHIPTENLLSVGLDNLPSCDLYTLRFSKDTPIPTQKKFQVEPDYDPLGIKVNEIQDLTLAFSNFLDRRIDVAFLDHELKELSKVVEANFNATPALSLALCREVPSREILEQIESIAIERQGDIRKSEDSKQGFLLERLMYTPEQIEKKIDRGAHLLLSFSDKEQTKLTGVMLYYPPGSNYPASEAHMVNSLNRLSVAPIGFVAKSIGSHDATFDALMVGHHCSLRLLTSADYHVGEVAIGNHRSRAALSTRGVFAIGAADEVEAHPYRMMLDPLGNVRYLQTEATHRATLNGLKKLETRESKLWRGVISENELFDLAKKCEHKVHLRISGSLTRIVLNHIDVGLKDFSGLVTCSGYRYLERTNKQSQFTLDNSVNLSAFSSIARNNKDLTLVGIFAYRPDEVQPQELTGNGDSRHVYLRKPASDTISHFRVEDWELPHRLRVEVLDDTLLAVAEQQKVADIANELLNFPESKVKDRFVNVALFTSATKTSAHELHSWLAHTRNAPSSFRTVVFAGLLDDNTFKNIIGIARENPELRSTIRIVRNGRELKEAINLV